MSLQLTFPCRQGCPRRMARDDFRAHDFGGQRGLICCSNGMGQPMASAAERNARGHGIYAQDAADYASEWAALCTAWQS